MSRAKITVRMPKQLHRRAVATAEAAGLSLNDWMSSVLDRAAMAELPPGKPSPYSAAAAGVSTADMEHPS